MQNSDVDKRAIERLRIRDGEVNSTPCYRLFILLLYRTSTPHVRCALSLFRYRVEETLGHAAFSTALQCVDLANSSLTSNSHNSSNGGSEPLSVCLKVIKNNKDFFDQSLDEIKLLHYLNSSGDPDAHHVLHM